MYHLRETGELDAETLNAMNRPRCGMPDTTPEEYTTSSAPPDQPLSFFVPGYKWDNTDLTYLIRNYASTSTVHPTTQREAIERAFQLWSDVSPLTFREVGSEYDADFKLEFVVGEHRDGPQNAFDGPGGVLAHAFYPQNGETHFDDEEKWVDRDTDGIDVTTVTAHELGHALGLGHSEVSGALMAPYYQGYDPNFSLSDDDQRAIQSLYGSAHEPTTTTTTTTRPTTTTTRERTTPSYPYSCFIRFGAATQVYDGSVHVFDGSQLWRLTEYGLDSDNYPVNTRTVYNYAPSTVDAAVYSTLTYQTYLFSGNKVWKYYGFRFLGGRTYDSTGNAANAMSAVTDQSGTIYLLKGITCWQFDEASLTVLRQPRMCLEAFTNAPINMDSALRITSQPGFVFFFRGPYYYKYDDTTARIEDGYPRLKADVWMGPVCGGQPYSPK